MSIDSELNRALKPVDPGPEFTARVLAAVAAEGGGPDKTVDTDPRRPDRGRDGGRRLRVWGWPALAASLVGAIVGARWIEDRRETARALQARTELIQALRLTSAKLNVARETMADRAEPPR